jgi:imidazolonepropionase-like amidohydrolase
MEAIHAATAKAAEFLGRTKDFGIVETGKVADVILLEANPVENIANTRKILAVIRDGRYFDRAALDSLLAKAAAAAQAVR